MRRIAPVRLHPHVVNHVPVPVPVRPRSLRWHPVAKGFAAVPIEMLRSLFAASSRHCSCWKRCASVPVGGSVPVRAALVFAPARESPVGAVLGVPPHADDSKCTRHQTRSAASLPTRFHRGSLGHAEPTSAFGAAVGSARTQVPVNERFGIEWSLHGPRSLRERPNYAARHHATGSPVWPVPRRTLPHVLQALCAARSGSRALLAKCRVVFPVFAFRRSGDGSRQRPGPATIV